MCLGPWQCFCGSPANPLGNGTSTNCVRPCSGDPNETCGGYAAISVYKYNDIPVEAPLLGSYVGCYVDSKSNRVMTDLNVDLDMTREVRETSTRRRVLRDTELGTATNHVLKVPFPPRKRSSLDNCL